MIKLHKFSSKRLVEDALMLSILIVCAYIAIPTGTVLFTFQVLALFIIFLRLHWIDSMIVTLLYASMGLVGLPVFSGGSSGIGPTTGYIIGFVLASLFIGLLKKIVRTPYPILNDFILCMISIVIYDICGSIFFYLYMDTTFMYALEVTVLPFLVFDIAKAIIASIVTEKLNHILPNSKE